MRVVAAVGGNALLERGEKPDEDIQEHHVQQAVTSLAPLALAHDLIVTHGNGPQVGLLALEGASDPALTRPYSLDVLGAQTQGIRRSASPPSSSARSTRSRKRWTWPPSGAGWCAATAPPGAGSCPAPSRLS